MKTNTFITLSTATANVGVLIGLVFLLFELKQTRRIALSEIRQERVSGIIDQCSANARDVAFSEMYHRVFVDAEFSLLENVEIKGQLLQHEFARFYRLEDSYFQHTIGLMDYAPYRFSMEMAVNRQPLWDFLGLDTRTRNSDWATDLDAFKSSPNYSPSDWREKFIAWEKSRGWPIEDFIPANLHQLPPEKIVVLWGNLCFNLDSGNSRHTRDSKHAFSLCCWTSL